MELQFKTKNPKQIEAVEAWIDSTTEEILYGGAKGGAKSYTGAALIFGSAHIYPGTQWFVARKELIDLKKFTIPTIHEVHQHWGLDIKKYLNFDGNLNVFTLPNGSKVFLIACADIPSDPMFERFGSMQMTGGWIEEAGEIAEAAKANLSLSIGRWKNDIYNIIGKLFITANPKKGWMKRQFVDPFKLNQLPKNKKYIQAFATDNVYLPKSYLEKLQNEQDPIRRQRLYEGNWDYDEDKDSMIVSDYLYDTFSNTIVKDNNKYLTVDVARLGQDSTVFGFWEGLELVRIEKYHKQDTEKTKEQLRNFAASERIPYSHILVDEDGIGGAVVDGMFGVKGFVANSSPLPTKTQIRERMSKIETEFTPKTNFANLKSQCGFKLAELINEHKIAFDVKKEYRDAIIEELSALLRVKEVDSDRKLAIKSKDEVKKDLGGRSPDIGDMIIFRAWFELREDATLENPDRERVINLQAGQFARNENNVSMNSTK